MNERTCAGCGKQKKTVTRCDDVLLCRACAKDAMDDRSHGFLMNDGPDTFNRNRGRDVGVSLGTLRTMPFEFRGTLPRLDAVADVSTRGVTVAQALELMSNGSCGD